ncbi:alpha/beta hydrolase fold domain-containing protein [Spirochaeta isovalerica]|uniref:Acetyl esterase/lipase n=1 Tax=Spirochaeta isovalerica TaxID=150 RepID=A0A841RIE2_9SPIO|nr:alpha/beta hydrolase fold domain-containing protein [Spirochaeta isovalerica]MBB6482072.1 acetyl esterase/lipase [Spirochaeta isovalerica]
MAEVLSPEHPFPAALEDCIHTYKWLLEHGYKAENIIIAGESAGGTLTLSTLKSIRENGLPQPAGAVAISPVTDLSCSADSFRRNAKKDIAPPGSMNIWTGFYIRKNDVSDPILSPAFGDHKNLAGTLLIAGTS